MKDKLSISIDEYGEYRVRFHVDAVTAATVFERLSSDPSYLAFDHGEDWAIFEGPGCGMVLVNYALEGSHVEVEGTTTPEGDDRFDYTRRPTELSLDDRIAVAAFARKAFAVAARA